MRLVLSACSTLCIQTAQAAAPHSACSEAIDAVVGQFLENPSIRSPEGRWEGQREGSPIVQSVCQRYPGERHVWQSVYVVDRNEVSQGVPIFDVVIALIDLQRRRVVASTKELLEPDALYDDKMQLSFAPPLGLPGPDVQLLRMPDRQANCAEGYLGNESTVYVVRGKELVSVVSGLLLDQEKSVGVCCGDEPFTVQETKRRLSRAASRKHGMPDVRMKVTVSDFNERTGKLRRVRQKKFLLHFNSARYEPSSGKLREMEECRLNPAPVSCKNLQPKK